MTENPSFFTFSFKFMNKNVRTDIACIFKSRGAIASVDYVDILEKTITGKLKPDLIQILLFESDFKKVVESFTKDDRIQREIERLSDYIGLIISGIDSEGSISKVKIIRKPIIDFDCQGYLPDLVIAGLRELVSKRAVITEAPSGTKFLLNDCAYPFFIRANRLCNTSAELQFVALSIALKMETKKIKLIYVDSSSVLAIGQELARTLVSGFGVKLEPRVESFRSYGGLSDFSPPTYEEFLILISASGSGRLAGQIKSLHQLNQNQIITLLADFTEYNQPVTRCSQVLCSIQDLTPKVSQSRLDQLKPIKVFGEDFQITHSVPACVTIRITDKTKALDQAAHFCSMPTENVFSTNVEISESTRDTPTTTYVNFEKFWKFPGFEEWLDSTINSQIPASSKLIVYQQDSSSKRLAQNIRKKLGGACVIPRIISASKLLEDGPVCETDSIIVVAAVVSRGTKLLEISRDLRLVAPKSMRTYIVGCLVPEKHSEFEVLKSNLSLTSGLYHYNFCSFFCVATGVQNRLTAWKMEHDLLTEMETKKGLSKYFRSRKSVLMETKAGLTGNLFWDSADGNSLSLSDGFVFLPSQVNFKCLSQADVFFLVSILLQSLREKKGSDIRPSLRPEDYQHRTLSPDNFYRFNDAVIQSSLLRAALPSEIDYSFDEQDSVTISQLILKICRRYHGSGGKAAMEFLVALASRRLNLVERVYSELVKDLNEMELPDPAGGLIRYLISVSDDR